MPATKVKTDENAEIFVEKLKRGSIKLRLIGTTALFQNRMSNKVRQGLLVGTRKKTKAERIEIKHAPIAEFRNSMEVMTDGPTAMGLRVVAIKAAMATAALETAGITKTSAQRLLFMPGDLIPLYGTPQLRMDVVRSADINRTPDVRTRAFFPRWGAEVQIDFVSPQLSAHSVVNLLANAGMLVGIGDFRQEKGKGGFGAFRVISADTEDAEWDDLVTKHNRHAQEKAFDDPEDADESTADLMEFFRAETNRRAA